MKGESNSSHRRSTHRYAAPNGSLASLVLESDELIYITRLKDILDAFPNKGPPYEPTQLTGHVFIGSQRNADDLGLLRRLGITHVVNCCGNRKMALHLNPYPRITGILRYIAFPAEDQSDYSILQHLPDTIEFLEHCKRMGGRALVHCNLGINRSGALSAAYLMLDMQRPLLQVAELLKKKRSVVLTNKGFRRQLVKFARRHNMLDAVVESRSTYLARSGSVSTLPGYSEYSTDIVPGEVGTSRPIARSTRHHQPSSSASLPRSTYHRSGGSLGSYPAIDESQSAPATPTRFHPAYCTLPRANGTSGSGGSSVGSSGGSSGRPQSASTNKRAIAASHYDQDYFMDTIPEDHHSHQQPKEGDEAPIFTPPSRHYLINLPKLSSKKAKSSTIVKSSSKHSIIESPAYAGANDEWVISSTRPLRVYKRSSTDSLLYQKPSTMHAYRRADTVATTDLAAGMDKMRLGDSSPPPKPKPLSEKHRSSSRTSLVSLSTGFFNKFKSRSRASLQNF